MVDVIKKHQLEIKTTLDIGTGTGLLSLMLAQENDFLIDALEINENAAIQAKENIESTQWKNQINIYNESLQEFLPQKKYDFIFSNPPFFENDLTSSNESKNAAKHDSSLTLDFLIDFITKHLSSDGYAAVLLPFHRTDYFSKLLEENKYFLLEKSLVRQATYHNDFRCMMLFSKKINQKSNSDEISIRDDSGNYSAEFTKLLQPYYLKL